ncbi:probable inactive receptor kinase [Tanacetum coccineum]
MRTIPRVLRAKWSIRDGLLGNEGLVVSRWIELKTLSLRFNSLTGLIPSDLSQCHNLRNLYLQGNRFSGVFPEVFFGSLRGLVRVNVGGNRLSGQISSGFANFTRLRTLYLEGNLFTGVLPNFEGLNLDQFNVSFNDLNGTIPKSLRAKGRDAFIGNEGLCGAEYRWKRRRTKKTSAIGVGASKMSDTEGLGEKPLTGTGGTGSGSNGFSVAAAAAAAMTTSSAAGGNVSAAGDASGNKKLVFFRNSSTIFDLEDLLRASAEVLGKGTFGTAYKAVLEAGTMVAVKRLKDVTVSEPEFREKIEFVGAMDHLNLVPLRAYYYSKEEKLLVYDYMPMGSLSALLHGNKGGGREPLTGNIRFSIRPGYSDFGLAHLRGHCLINTHDVGVAGYRAPEVTDPRRVSQKADVYSFGVLVLELLTGKAPTHALLNEEGVDLPRWVQSTVKEEWTSEVFDLELLRYQNVEEEMVQLLQLAIDCAAQYPDNRPTMSEVTKRIEELRGSSLVKGTDQGHGLESD